MPDSISLFALLFHILHCFALVAALSVISVFLVWAGIGFPSGPSIRPPKLMVLAWPTLMLLSVHLIAAEIVRLETARQAAIQVERR